MKIGLHSRVVAIAAVVGLSAVRGQIAHRDTPDKKDLPDGAARAAQLVVLTEHAAAYQLFVNGDHDPARPYIKFGPEPLEEFRKIKGK